jgi:hypothetical protein
MPADCTDHTGKWAFPVARRPNCLSAAILSLRKGRIRSPDVWGEFTGNFGGFTGKFGGVTENFGGVTGKFGGVTGKFGGFIENFGGMYLAF